MSAPHTAGRTAARYGLGSMQGAFTPTPDGRRWSAVQTSFNADDQVEQTIPLIRAYAKADSTHPYIVAAAAAAPGRTTVERAWRSAKQYLTFKDDQSVAGLAGVDTGDDIIEVLQRPADVAEQYNMTGGAPVPGDCDDYSMFVASIARAIDPDCDINFVCVAAEANAPGVLSHIYVTIDGVPCDASHGLYPGWEVPREHITRRVEYPLSLSIPLLAFAASAVWFFLAHSAPGQALVRRLMQ